MKNNIRLFDDMIATMRFRRDVMAASAKNGFTNATDAADYLVVRGVPFRDAHGIIGRLVLYCINKNCALDDLSLEEFRQFSLQFDEDIYEAISLETCVEKRLTAGAPGRESMHNVIKTSKQYLKEKTEAER
jgi:argininosuccinate lyase